jgi:hypothetical protein
VRRIHGACLACPEAAGTTEAFGPGIRPGGRAAIARGVG